LNASETLISVVVPAYNATRTLARTLESALNQTHRAVEILVVDDGSTDGTAELARGFAARDGRVRVITQANAGVARARNSGIELARADYLAPLDADDLWHPTKLEKQLSVLNAAPPDTAFVYCAFRTIDEEDRVLGHSSVFRLRGRVFHRHALVNFVGNGSALLLRRTAVLECGGYDPSLRDAGFEGTEDFLLQLRLASRYPVDVVPEYLVGYRRGAGAMSERNEVMGRSFLAAIERAPNPSSEARRALDWAAGPFLATCAVRAAWRGQVQSAASLLALGFGRDAFGAAVQTASIAKARAVERLRRAGAAALAPKSSESRARRFYDFDPTESRVEGTDWFVERRLAKMALLDAR
jgi:Glycosyl transferase family 2